MMKNFIKNRPDSFRVSRPKAALGFGVNQGVADTAKCDEVFYGVVAEFPRIAFATPVDVMDMQIFVRSALTADVSIARKNGWLQPLPKRGVCLHQLGPVRPFRAAHGGFVRLEVAKLVLASLAAFLWATVINVVVSTVGTLIGRADYALAGLSAKLDKVFEVVSRADNRNARLTHLLASTCRLVGRFALAALTILETSSGLTVGLQRTWLASFEVWRSLQNRLITAGTNDRSVSPRGHLVFSKLMLSIPPYKSRLENV